MAVISGYYDRPTQILPHKGVALVIWDNKVTGNISTLLHFHASKELARNYLSAHTRDKWPNEHFDEVDWKHLELALKNKAGIYKVWWSKQVGFLQSLSHGGNVLWRGITRRTMPKLQKT